MSTIQVNAIQSSTGTQEVTQTTIISGTAKAGSNFNGQTSAERSSFNISSYTDNAAGDFDYNFSNGMADADYSVSTCYDMQNLYAGYNASLQIEALLSSDANLKAWYGSAGASADVSHMHATFMGDLA